MIDVRETLNNVKNEIRRIDHLIYVSLKYTRTVDVIRYVLERMVNALEFGMDILLEHLRKKKRITIPKAPRLKAEMIKSFFQEDEKLQEFMNFYLFLRNLLRAEYKRREEYRRHVTMIAELGPENFFEVDIDRLNDYHRKIKEWQALLEEFIK